MAEIYMRGPVAAAIAGGPIHKYTGGVFADETASKETTHIVSIIGWGVDKTSGQQHWIGKLLSVEFCLVYGSQIMMRADLIPFAFDFQPKILVRNSWGEYWGEMGFFRVEIGKNLLGIESNIAWATPRNFTTSNFACWSDGTNCGSPSIEEYVDPYYFFRK